MRWRFCKIWSFVKGTWAGVGHGYWIGGHNFQFEETFITRNSIDKTMLIVCKRKNKKIVLPHFTTIWHVRGRGAPSLLQLPLSLANSLIISPPPYPFPFPFALPLIMFPPTTRFCFFPLPPPTLSIIFLPFFTLLFQMLLYAIKGKSRGNLRLYLFDYIVK